MSKKLNIDPINNWINKKQSQHLLNDEPAIDAKKI